MSDIYSNGHGGGYANAGGSWDGGVAPLAANGDIANVVSGDTITYIGGFAQQNLAWRIYGTLVVNWASFNFASIQVYATAGKAGGYLKILAGKSATTSSGSLVLNNAIGSSVPTVEIQGTGTLSGDTGTSYTFGNGAAVINPHLISDIDLTGLFGPFVDTDASSGFLPGATLQLTYTTEAVYQQDGDVPNPLFSAWLGDFPVGVNCQDSDYQYDATAALVTPLSLPLVVPFLNGATVLNLPILVTAINASQLSWQFVVSSLDYAFGERMLIRTAWRWSNAGVGTWNTQDLRGQVNAVANSQGNLPGDVQTMAGQPVYLSAVGGNRMLCVAAYDPDYQTIGVNNAGSFAVAPVSRQLPKSTSGTVGVVTSTTVMVLPGVVQGQSVTFPLRGNLSAIVQSVAAGNVAMLDTAIAGVTEGDTFIASNVPTNASVIIDSQAALTAFTADGSGTISVTALIKALGLASTAAATKAAGAAQGLMLSDANNEAPETPNTATNLDAKVSGIPAGVMTQLIASGLAQWTDSGHTALQWTEKALELGPGGGTGLNAEQTRAAMALPLPDGTTIQPGSIDAELLAIEGLCAGAGSTAIGPFDGPCGPLVNVVVTVYSDSARTLPVQGIANPATTTATSQGYVSFNLPSGTFYWTANLTGWGSQQGEVVVP